MAVKGERVVLRGVQVVVLEELTPTAREGFLSAHAPTQHEAWIPEAMAHGSFDAAVEAHAGRSGEEDNKPGRYRAVKKAAWLERGPRVIEPPIA